MAVVVRAVTEEDLPAACDVMRKSIRALCAKDHNNDEAILSAWLKDKTVDALRPHVTSETNLSVVVLRGGIISGLGLITRNGELCLCYVAPEATGLGCGAAILDALERQATSWGLKRIFLTSTVTARGFYEHHGYVPCGKSVVAFGMQEAQPMEKAIAL